MYRIKTSIALGSFFISVCLSTYGQQQTDIYTPKVIQPSPNAAALTKYGDIPVSQYTGSAEASIPLYTIQSGDISVPISLSATTTGIRLSEEASWTGLGWSLSAGGVISRTIMDKDDFDDTKYFTSTVPEIDTTLLGNTGYGYPLTSSFYDFYCNYYVNTAKGALDFTNALVSSAVYDFEADIYSFNFPGYSGKFFIKRNKQVVLSKQENLKIEFNTAGTVFIITDDKGFKYIFSDLEYTKSNADPIQRVSSWYLTKIISPTNAVVQFNYLRSNNWTYTLQTTSQTYRYGCSFSNGLTSTTNPATEYLNITLQSIDFTNGKVQFYADGDRLDLQNGNKLNKVTVFKKLSTTDSSELYSYQFYYSYFNDAYTTGVSYDYKRLRLDSIKQSTGTTLNPPYKFTYYGAAGGYAAKTAFSVDYWGYYNGVGNSILYPSFYGYGPSGNILALDGANRKPDPEYAKQFSLQSISYPTGGKSVFEMEGNDYDENNSLPITFDAEEINFVNKGFNTLVSAKGTTSGSVVWPKKYGNKVSFAIAFRCKTASDATALHSSGGLINLSIFGTTIDIASSSLVLQGAGNVWATGTMSIDISSRDPQNWSAYISPTGTTQFEDISLRVDWKELERASNGSIMGGGLRIKSITDYDGLGIVVKKRKYDYNYFEDRDNDGIAEKYSYGRRMSPLFFSRKEALWGLEAEPPPGFPAGTKSRCISFTRFSSPITSVSAALSGNIIGYDQVTEWIVDPANENNTLGKTVYQFYNDIDGLFSYSGFRLPGMSNFGAAKNGLLRKKTDYRVSGGAFYKVAQAENFYSVPYSKVIYNLKYDNVEGGYPKTGQPCPPGSPMTQTEYLGFLFPAIQSQKVVLDSTRQTIYDAADQGKYVITTTRHNYDNVNHYQLTRSTVRDSKGNVHVSFIKYPQDFLSGSSTGNVVLDSMIAKNMVSASVEKRDSLYAAGSSSGNLVGASAQLYKISSGMVLMDKQYKLKVAAPLSNYQPVVVSVGALTLDSRYKQMISIDSYDASGNITQFTTVNGIITSYVWGYNNAYPVAEVVGVPYSSIVVNQSIVQNASTTDAAMRTELNNIRVQFPTAQVKTYTYSPLLGITSETDANGRTIYYQYDSFARLQLIKDKDGNVIKTFEYHYKQ